MPNRFCPGKDFCSVEIGSKYRLWTLMKVGGGGTTGGSDARATICTAFETGPVNYLGPPPLGPAPGISQPQVLDHEAVQWSILSLGAPGAPDSLSNLHHKAWETLHIDSASTTVMLPPHLNLQNSICTTRFSSFHLPESSHCFQCLRRLLDQPLLFLKFISELIKHAMQKSGTAGVLSLKLLAQSYEKMFYSWQSIQYGPHAANTL